MILPITLAWRSWKVVEAILNKTCMSKFKAINAMTFLLSRNFLKDVAISLVVGEKVESGLSITIFK